MIHKASNRVLVTSGPTRAYVDRIRYFTNTSTGALGARIVESLIKRNIPVVHLYGCGSKLPEVNNRKPPESIAVTTVDDVIDAVKKIAARGDIGAVVHAMAVLDYAPETRIDTKKKSGESAWEIRLVRTPKVIEIMRSLMPDAFFAGFKLETGVTEEDLAEQAGVLLNKYSLDMVIANDLDMVGKDSHRALFVGKGNRILARLNTKEEIAEKLADILAERFV